MYIISYFNMPPLFYAVGASGIVDDYVVRNFAAQNYTKKMTYASSTSFFFYFSALMQQKQRCELLQTLAGYIQVAELEVFLALRFAVGVIPRQDTEVERLSGRHKDRLIQLDRDLLVLR